MSGRGGEDVAFVFVEYTEVTNSDISKEHYGYICGKVSGSDQLGQRAGGTRPEAGSENVSMLYEFQGI